MMRWFTAAFLSSRRCSCHSIHASGPSRIHTLNMEAAADSQMPAMISCGTMTTVGRYNVEEADDALGKMGASEILKQEEDDDMSVQGESSTSINKSLLHKWLGPFSRSKGGTTDETIGFPEGYQTETARYLVGHSSAAYCKLHSTPLFECGCHSERAPVDGFHYVVRAHDDKQDASGFAGYDTKRKAIVASFRGTVSLTNWKANLIFLKKRDHEHHGEKNNHDGAFSSGVHATSGHTYPTRVKVHSGFFHTYRSIKDQIIASVVQMKKEHPDYQVFVTGHSLGGAQATFCVADLAYKHGIDSIIAYTFGQPRVFDVRGHEFFHSLKGVRLYRVVNGLDPVPGLPGRVVGFRHVGSLIHFMPADKKEVQSALQKNANLASLEGFSRLSSRQAGLHRFRIVDHLVYAERYGAQRILRGQDPPPDPWDPETRAYRNAVSGTLSLFLDEFPNKAALVFVYAPWCPHCKKFFPTFRKLARKHRKNERVQFLAIDGSANDCPDGYVPQSFPTIFLCKRKGYGSHEQEGKELYVGSRDLDALESTLAKWT